MTGCPWSASGANNLRRRVRGPLLGFLWSLGATTDVRTVVRCRVVITLNELASRVIVGGFLDLFELCALFGKELAKMFLCVKQ